MAKLGYAWEHKLGTRRGLEATPVVVDGVLYTSGVFGWVYAVDAATGKELWTYDPEVDGQYGRYACCDANNRGVAVWRGHVYVGALDGYLHSIDATTGKRLWKVDTLPARGPKTPFTLSAAPVVAGDVVIVGSAGADFAGARGDVAAYVEGARWLSPAALLFREAVVQGLMARNSGLTLAGPGETADRRLTVRVQRFEVDLPQTGGRPAALVRIVAEASVVGRDGRLLFQKQLTAEKAAPALRMSALSAAFDEAMGAFDDQLAALVASGA